jgi:hypothetical protein
LLFLCYHYLLNKSNKVKDVVIGRNIKRDYYVDKVRKLDIENFQFLTTRPGNEFRREFVTDEKAPIVISTGGFLNVKWVNNKENPDEALKYGMVMISSITFSFEEVQEKTKNTKIRISSQI